MAAKIKDKQLNIRSKGFSLIEILIVTVITMAVFTVIYGFYSASIKNNVEIRYEMIASNLAQEGIEIIRNVRDENVMAEEDINVGLDESPCYPYIDGNGGTSCGSSLIKDIQINNDDWYENCPTTGCGEETPFRRECTISGDSTSITAVCTVEWNSFINSGLERKAEATAILTDWQ